MDRGSGTYIVAPEVVDRGLGKHRVVFELRLAERRGVAGLRIISIVKTSEVGGMLTMMTSLALPDRRLFKVLL